MGPKCLIPFEITINVFVSLSDSFEYLCYRSNAIINIFILTVRGSTLVVRMILTTKVYPRAVRVNPSSAEIFSTQDRDPRLLLSSRNQYKCLSYIPSSFRFI